MVTTSYSAWVSDMPTTETAWEAWRAQGQRNGWVNGEAPGRAWLEGKARLYRGMMENSTAHAVLRGENNRLPPDLRLTPEAVQAIAWPALKSRPDPSGIDAADLLAMDLPPLRMVAPGLGLPEGTDMIVSPPKVGKSCLIYQLVVETALGGSLFEERVESGSALYFALEDGHRRGQDRLRAALAGRTMPRDRLEVRWSAPRIGEGLEDGIAQWLDTHRDATIVAIDTLGRVRPNGGERRNAYDVDVAMIGRLQAIFRDRQTALVLVHHTNKGTSDDFVAQVSGTYGVAGSVDTIINIRRKREEAFGTIYVTGRDVPDAKVSVRFDEMTWTLAPEAIAEATFQRTEVYRAIEAIGPAWPKAIADHLGLERTNVQHRVEGLVDGGLVTKSARGYAISGVRVSLSIPNHSSHSKSDSSEGVQKEPDSWDPELATDDDGELA